MSLDLYFIEIVEGLPRLYEYDEGLLELEDLDYNERLDPGEAGTYLLKEVYANFIEVKVLTPTLSQDDDPRNYYRSSKYYTDLLGNIISDSGELGDDSSETEDDGPSSGDDSYSGGDDDDDRSGLEGDDFFRGYGGSDRFRGDDGDDYLDGGDDNDSLDGGADDDSLFGGKGDDFLKGGIGDDFLDAGEGDDNVIGGEGDDEFVGGHGEGYDRYNGGGGIDDVTYISAAAGITVNLKLGRAGSLDNGDAGIGSDRLTSIENVVAGGWGDWLIGSAVANLLDGRGGADRIDGGRGADTSIGGEGADIFVISKASDTGLGARADRIIDFSGSLGDGDRIDLSAIDAKKGFTRQDAFRFIATAPVGAEASNGVIWFDAGQGYVFASIDKDAQAEFAIRVLGVTEMTADDFLGVII